MFYKKSSLIFLLFIILASCTNIKPVTPLLRGHDLIYKIRLENPFVCSLKKKAIFFIEDRFNKNKFKGYIIKNCDDSFVLNILGPFNQVAYKVTYKDKKFDILKSNKSVKNELSLMIDDTQVAQLSSLLNIPLISPDNSFKLNRYDDKYYYLKKDDLIIIVDRNNYKINKIIKKSAKLFYSYEDNSIKELHFLEFPVDIRIKFL